ncbi:uncharacterized protein rp1l1a [Eucyclogobius newberryi]|uniref:uncharacterized protein rp1l1a n=1 Tax=Eucyclogobius newberryi TaxID=166745 RepID=UPI003B58E76D
MQSVHAGMWDPPSKQHACPLVPPNQPHSPQTRPDHVRAPQAKRITFYKSGDSQFGGVKMAVHNRSFKCFDALLDDLSQKVPLPFGVRTVTTPRGTHTIQHLEQLQDGGCYLCSDRRQAKPINMDIATKRPGVWSHHGRRPHRPESTSATSPGHVPYRQRRLLLVKNTEPAVRGSVVLSRRVTRSLRAFLEEASNVMQFHVHKLYTVEGRKIDNVQSLMTGPNMLVCAGREGLSPLLVNYIRKGSDEKLPGVGPRTPGNGARSPPQGAQSGASEQSEGQDSKKNTVNFGLETKKSIIHPRSDSSNRSARLSMSSEKSYGLSTMSQGQAAVMDDDIEKRVVVNKDGSLSVEMKVRFRLHSDETLQWSTQIKKSPYLTNDSCSISQGQTHYLQHESCSDLDCNSYELENRDYSFQCAMAANTCPCCYREDLQYDLWKNPVHSPKPPIPPSHSTTESHTILRHTRSSSSSSSSNSTRVVRCRAKLTNCEDGSEHSQIVQEEMSITEQHIGGKDISTVSRSCSRSEVVNGDALAFERPMSAISASSHILQELKEDDDELPPSASRCGNKVSETSEFQNNDKSASNASTKQNGGGNDEEEGSTCQCHSTSEVEVNGRASTSKSNANSCKSITTANYEIEEVETVVSGLSVGSRRSTSVCPDCGGWKAKIASCCNSRASNGSNNKSSKPSSVNPANDEDDNISDVSSLSNTSNLTYHREVFMISNGEYRAASVMSKTEEEVEETRATSVTSSTSCNSRCKNCEIVENRSPSVISFKSENSNCNVVSDPITREEAEGDNTAERVASAMSAKSNTSTKTSCSQKSRIKVTAPTSEEGEETRSASVQSEESNISAKKSGPVSAKSTKTEEETRSASVSSVKSNESRSASPMSTKSSKTNVSEKSSGNEMQNLEVKSTGKKSRPASVLSVKSIKSEASKKEESRTGSVISVTSNGTAKSTKSVQNKIQNMKENNDNDEVKSDISAEESRPASEISVKSTNSERSQKVQSADDDTRSVSIVSVKSKSIKESRPSSVLSVQSNKSHVSDKSKNENKSNTEQRSMSPRPTAEKNGDERGESALSNKSRKSMSNCTEISQNGEEKHEGRAASSISCKSTLSVKTSKTNKSSRLASPTKEQDEERTLSASSGKTHFSAVSDRSKKSNQTVISTNVNEENDNKSESVTSHVSVKSRKSNRFHVVPIKTPEVASNDRPTSSASAKTEKSNVSTSSKQNKMVDANKSLVEDQATKSRNLMYTLELMPENRDHRGTSSLSVRSCKSTKSKSKCSCEKPKDIDDKDEDSEVAASISSSKREDCDEESFASVSLVLPDDQESESGESRISSRRRSPEVTKSPHNAEIGPTIPNAIYIPTIETPGQGNDETRGVASSCSTKSTHSVRSTKSKKSCSNCGKVMTQVDADGTASLVASVKSIATTKTGQLTTPDNRISAMSTASPKSQRKLAKCEDIDNASEGRTEQASEAEVEDDEIARAKSKSPATLRPKSGVSNPSRAKSSKTNDESIGVQSVRSSRNKEENDKSPCSESILHHSLSAADLAKEVNAAKLPESPGSKLSNPSNKSTKSQRSKKEVEQELTPSCLPNASPNEVVSDWLNRIPANMLALGDEEGDKCVEEIEIENGISDEAEVKGEDGDLKTKDESEREKEGTKEEGEAVEKFEIRPIGIVTESSLPKNWHSSAAVMKVLLSSSLGRCRSMPEVSHVYGRRLSASAKELLDCLTQLQLIEPAGNQAFSIQKDQRPQFEDIISTLQTLWLSEPRDPKDPNRTDQASPPRSSSGVGMSSGSGGSGKDNVNQDDEPKQDEEVETKTEEVSVSPEGPKMTVNPSSLDKNTKTPTVNELDTQERSPAVLHAPVTKHKSQDPDPMWVLRLLKKLEKQFINHYVTAMSDFKVKWDLEDSLILDKMIAELRDEVSQRIEKSVEREVKKIQSRAGNVSRVPRPPPVEQQSTDSMTDRRKRLLKVMKNHSIKTGDSLSELTGENSDQRSDDEFCPCDACVTKKMASRSTKTNPDAIKPPVQKEFDLLKILLFKTAPVLPVPVVAKPEKKQEEAQTVVQEDSRNLEVVVEEEEDEDEEDEEEEETSEDLDSEGVAEGAKCHCQRSQDYDEEETEESDRETVKEKSSHKEETMEETSKGEMTVAEEDEGGDEETTDGGESEEASTEERASEQESRPAVSATEGEDADVEDSGTEDKSDHEAEMKIKLEIKTENIDPKLEKNQSCSLRHQFTKTSVESQPGSLEDLQHCPSPKNVEGPKLVSPGGTIQKRSRSPAQVKNI